MGGRECDGVPFQSQLDRFFQCGLPRLRVFVDRVRLGQVEEISDPSRDRDLRHWFNLTKEREHVPTGIGNAQRPAPNLLLCRRSLKADDLWDGSFRALRVVHVGNVPRPVNVLEPV